MKKYLKESEWVSTFYYLKLHLYFNIFICIGKEIIYNNESTILCTKGHSYCPSCTKERSKYRIRMSHFNKITKPAKMIATANCNSVGSFNCVAGGREGLLY